MPTFRRVFNAFIFLVFSGVCLLGLHMSDPSIAPFAVHEHTFTHRPESANSATGMLFSGDVIRHFGAARACSQPDFADVSVRVLPPQCRKWNVVTTIYNATAAVHTAAAVPGWCTVIIGDRKTPISYMEDSKLGRHKNVFFLSAVVQEVQARSRYDAVGAYMRHVPFDHFARKNIGYLYAIAHGAEFIFDFDDDNSLKSSEVDMIPWTDATWRARQIVASPLLLNVYPLMHPTVDGTWPRGLPLELVKTPANATIVSPSLEPVAVSRIGVLQYTADHDPDVDAVYRMTRSIPFDFQDSPHTSVVLPLDTYSPYNAQATLHTKNALWATLLPFTVPGRVSDIWRGFFAQCIFSRIGLQLAFGRPLVRQVRNIHNYLADMNAETAIYFKAQKLVEFLSQWQDNSGTVPEAVENLWIALYERTYIERDDVVAVQLWLRALRDSGYIFPLFKNTQSSAFARPFSQITLLGQFNWNTAQSQVSEWVRMWSQVFPVSNAMLAIPQDRTVFHHNTVQREAVPEFVRYIPDKGFYTPMLNLIYAIQESPTTQGVLYVHDDMILSSALLTHIGTEKWVATFNPEDTFRWLRDGTFTGNTPPSSWVWWGRDCVSPLQNIASDPEMDQFWGDNGSLPVAWGQSDMLYVNTTNRAQMAAFTALLNIFARHKLFLECAIPSAVAIMQEKYAVRVHWAVLCTNWGFKRPYPSMWPCIDNTHHEAFHPIKPSDGMWSHYFQTITMNQHALHGQWQTKQP